MVSNSQIFTLGLFFAVGLYLINIGFVFVEIPVALSQFLNPWISLVGGILVMWGGLNYIRLASMNRRSLAGNFQNRF